MALRRVLPQALRKRMGLCFHWKEAYNNFFNLINTFHGLQFRYAEKLLITLHEYSLIGLTATRTFFDTQGILQGKLRLGLLKKNHA
jgi:hypothetical protein